MGCGLSALKDPGRWEEFVELLNGVRWDAREHITEPGERRRCLTVFFPSILKIRWRLCDISELQFHRVTVLSRRFSRGTHKLRAVVVPLTAVAAMLSVFLPVYSQTTSGSISGTVVDSQSAPIAGAKVTGINIATKASLSVTTAPDGHFVFASLPPSSYTIDVVAPGFKQFEQTGVVLNANAAVAVGTIQLEVGTIKESVTVAAEGEQVTTDTAQMSDAIVGKQLQNIEVNGRSPLFMLRLIPGVNSPNDYSQSNVNFGNNYVNGSRGNQSNYTLNGAGNVDTGSNGSSLVTISLDSIQEFQVLTANYQAQYGRSSGAQISVVSKSGTQDFHGSLYEYYRDKGLNANSWINNRQALPVAQYHYNDYGFTVGGPVYIPRVFNQDKNKLFFFWSNEWQKQLVPETAHNVTVPTALERNGNFSQSVDQTGAPVTIKNPFAGGAPFPNNTIPANMLSPVGQKIMNIFPLPNALDAVNKGFNYTSQVSDEEPRLEDLVRIDYNLSSKWRISGTYVLNHQQDVSAYGSFGLVSNFPATPLLDDRPAYLMAYTVTTVINPTTTNEATFDLGHNQININPVETTSLTRSALGLTGLSSLYPPHDDYIPKMGFGGTRIGNSPNLDTSNSPFYNYNTTIEAIDNFSKVLGSHTTRFGFYFQRSRKNQTSSSAANGAIDFGDNPNNPLDTGFGYANAALGVFNSYQQASQYVTGEYRYTNAEFYLQDTWKASRRLTLDYGVRFAWIQPQYDAALLTSNFYPNVWSASQAPQLYQPALNAGQRVGQNPITGAYVPSVDIGTIVPGTGSLTNGILQAGHGVSKYLMDTPGIIPAPRIGLTYDLTGHQNIVFHSGFGIFYDRYQGNEIFNQINNPPTTFQPTVYYGQLASVNPSNATIGVSSLNSIDYSGKIPTTYSYSAGIEARLPWSMLLDTSFVGSQSRHLIVLRNLNAIPYGATFLPQNQDPTLVATNPNAQLGSNAYPAQFLTRYRGYNDGITNIDFGGNSNYNSLQVSLKRRFASGLFFGIAYTWSKCMDIADDDGTYQRIDNLTKYANYGECGFNVTQNFALNYVYAIPDLPKVLGPVNNVVTRALLNHWQISGYTSFISGNPVGVGFSIPNIGNPQITGSYTEGARVALSGINPTAGTSDNPYNRINPAAFIAPPVGSIGIDSPRFDLTGPGVNDFDISLVKNIPIKERYNFEIRGDAFNVFNHTQFSGLESTINFTSLTNSTPTNLPYNSSGQLVNLFGFGSVSGVRSPRILQLVARFTF